MRTTLNNYGIATSISKEVDYLISTVENPSNSGRYETIIKRLGLREVPIVVVTKMSAKEATCAHISAFRMVYSTNREDWSRELLDSFATDELVNLVSESTDNSHPNSLQDDFCIMLLELSGLYFKKESSSLIKGIKKFFGR